jgi:hypothetical protein
MINLLPALSGRVRRQGDPDRGGAPGEPAAKRLSPAPTVLLPACHGGGAQDGAALYF